MCDLRKDALGELSAALDDLCVCVCVCARARVYVCMYIYIYILQCICVCVCLSVNCMIACVMLRFHEITVWVLV